MLLTRASLLIDRSKAERAYFLRVHVLWNWTQMCDDTSIIHNLVRLIDYSAKKIPVFSIILRFTLFSSLRKSWMTLIVLYFIFTAQDHGGRSIVQWFSGTSHSSCAHTPVVDLVPIWTADHFNSRSCPLWVNGRGSIFYCWTVSCQGYQVWTGKNDTWQRKRVWKPKVSAF